MWSEICFKYKWFSYEDFISVLFSLHIPHSTFHNSNYCAGTMTVSCPRGAGFSSG